MEQNEKIEERYGDFYPVRDDKFFHRAAQSPDELDWYEGFASRREAEQFLLNTPTSACVERNGKWVIVR